MQKLLREGGGSVLDPELHAALFKAYEEGDLLAPEL
jgi:hypothetical protein